MSALPLSPRPPAPAPPRPRPAPRRTPRLRVVDPPRRTRRYLAVMVVAGTLGIFGSVALNALAAEQAFAARELQVEVDELSQRYDELTAEVARLEAPDRVAAVAAGELGMVPAEQPAFLVVGRRSGSAKKTMSASTMQPSG